MFVTFMLLWLVVVLQVLSDSYVTVISVVTFRVSRRQHDMYSDHARLCVCLSVCLWLAAFTHYCTDPVLTWGNGRGAP